MFKTYADFADAAPKDHPGQPAHSDRGFDVWRQGNSFLLITDKGEKLVKSSLNEAIDFAQAALKPATSVPATPVAETPTAAAPVSETPVALSPQPASTPAK